MNIKNHYTKNIPYVSLFFNCRKSARNIFFSTFIIVPLLFISCGRESIFRSDNSPKTVIPKVSRDTDKAVEKSVIDQNVQESLPQPRVHIGNDSSILYIKNINLDFDAEDEQVIVAVLKDEKQNLRIIVLDFDSVRNKYVITWENEKSGMNYRSFSLSYLDIVGDHNLEIIFSGTSSSNNQVLDVFRKTHSPSGIRLYYESICNIDINGQIEVQEKERSQAYNLGQKNGISFPIITYEDMDSFPEQIPSIRKTSYMWNYQSNKYINAIEEIIPVEIVEEQKINKMFFDGIDAYKSFLEGQWYNIDSDEFIIRFNKEGKEITFFTSDILEIYKWSDFNYSRLSKTIDINARNDLIHFITKRILIKIESMNRIRVDIKDRENPKDTDQMNGYYERISEDVITSISASRDKTPETIKLSGEYSGANDVISFSGSDFILKSGNSNRKGIFSVYDYNNDLILELRFFDDNQICKEIRLYRMNYDEKEMEASIVKRLVLTKGILTTTLFKPSGTDPLLYLQTIEK